MRFAVLCAVLISACGLSQTAEQAPPKKVLTPEQIAYQQALKEYGARAGAIASAANVAYAAETAPECPNASNTYEINMCLSHEGDITDGNYKAFMKALRDLLALEPAHFPGEQVPYVGPTGRAATPETSIAAFDKAEAAWKAYADAECGVVDTEWRGGTIVNAMVGECSLRQTRERMHELNTVYSDRLHPH